MATFDVLDLRACLARFATGVTVVTFMADNEPRGATVNSFTSVSLDPPLVLVSMARSAKATRYLADSPFCVNVLDASQTSLALTFAGKPGVTPEWTDGVEVPRLKESHAWFCCAPWRSYEGGDHVLFLGEVREFAFSESYPLVFHSGIFRVPPEHQSDGV